MKTLKIKSLSIVLAFMMVISAFMSIAPQTVLNASAFTMMNQLESQWYNYSFNGGTMAATGCGIFSLANAVGYLTGNQMDVVEIATWAHNNGMYNVYGADGTYRTSFYWRASDRYGEDYGFEIDTADGSGYWGDVNDDALKSHLANGGTAVAHVYNHFIALVGYDYASDSFHVWDCAPRDRRGTLTNGGDVWFSTYYLCTATYMTIDWFCMLSPLASNRLDGHDPIFIGNDFAAYIRHTASGKYVTDVDNNLKAEDGRFDASQAFHFFYNSDDGTYSMYSDAKNKWFDVAESSYTDGTNVGLWDGNGQENQRFYMYYINGNFYFRPKAECIVFDIAAHDGNLALWGDSTGDNDVSRTARAFEVLKINMDYSDWYLDLGADDVVYIRNVASGLLMTGDWNQDVWFSGPDYTDSQKWKLLRRADGSYEFMHVMTGKLLDVEGGFIDSGTRVNLWDCNGQKGQGFYILPGDENAYVIKPCYTEHVLDMSAENGDVGIYPPHLDWDVPRAAQLFEIVFEKIDGNTIPAENIGTDFKATITTKKTGNALTDLGNGVLEAHPNTNANNQIFKFYYDASSNSYEIVGNSGKAIDVTGTGYTNGTSVGLFDRNNWVAQRFHLHKVGEYYALSPIFTNRVVDVDNNNNTTVILWGTDVTDNRLFKITPVTDTPDPDPSEDTLVLKNTSKYSKDGSILYNVAAGQTVSGLIGNFNNSSIEIHDANGNKVANNAKVGTGYTVNLIVNGTKYDSVTVVIKGDVTGDGIVDTTDYMRVKAQFLGTYNLTSCYKLAADTDSNNVIDTTDYLRVKNHFIGVYNLYA